MKKSIFEDGNKVLYETDNEDELLCKYTDDLVDARGNVKGTIKNKAAMSGTIAAHIFKVLSSYHVPTYFKSQKSAKELLLKKANLVPLLFLVANETSEQGVVVPVVQYESIADGQKKEMDSDEIMALEILTQQAFADARRYILKMNVVLRNFFERRGLELLGFSMQFGFVNGKLTVCSDFTLANCDLKDAGSRTKFTTAYLISHLENAAELYEQVHKRIIF